MKKRLTIGVRLYLGFGALLLLTTIAFLFTLATVKSSRGLNDRINYEISPSVQIIEAFKLEITQSKMWVENWFRAGAPNNNPDAPSLRRLILTEHPQLKNDILKISKTWDEDSKAELNAILGSVDTLFQSHKLVMSQLNSLDAYKDPMIYMFEISPMFERTGDITLRTKTILEQLEKLSSHQRKNANFFSREMVNSFDLLQNVVNSMGVVLVIFGLLIAVFTVRSIVLPIDKLRIFIQKLAKGIMPAEIIKYRNDEIGDMSIAVSNLKLGLESTTQFAKEVGAGNFDSDYKPLSEEDRLGEALLKMRSDLAENERMLEFKVMERTEEVVRQKEHIETQRAELEYVFSQVTDSIRYAKRIQDAILPPQFFVKQVLPQSFILFKPKDIVSGDFYFVEKRGKKVFFSSVDCTGHGVPGAFMSIVGYNLLKNAVIGLENPTASMVLDELSRGVSETLHQNNATSTSKDGMDISMCAIDLETKTLEFAGAYTSLYLVRNKEVQEIDGDKLSIGIFVATAEEHYTNKIIQLQEGDTIYISTDGYRDQFGGPQGKKFLARRLRELLLEINDMPMLDQRQKMMQTIEDWRGQEEQVDDILVMGFRV
ncbi:MAG: SpoIIE family protein phosphatase [Bacteroidia bacterium]